MVCKRQVALVAALMLLATLLQAASIARSVVPARDAVEFVTVAQALQRDGWRATLHNEPQPPLFPAMVYAVHTASVRVGLLEPRHWALAAQIAAAVPLVLCVVPLYLFWRKLIGPLAAASAALLFIVLPEVLRLGADGVSDSTHLCLACCALWASASWFTRDARHSVWLFVAGVFTGLALMARAEIIVLPVVLAVTVAWSARWWHRTGETPVAPRKQAGDAPFGLVALALGLALVLVPYLIASDALTPSSAVARVLGRQAPRDELPINATAAVLSQTPMPVVALWHLPDGQSMVFGRKDAEVSHRFHGSWETVRELARELGMTFQYWIGALVLIGLLRRRLRLGTPADGFLWLQAGVFLCAVAWVAGSSGYLSSRHLLLFVVLSIGWAPLGIAAIAKGVQWLLKSASSCPVVPANVLSAALAIVAAVACLPRGLEPVHATHRPYRQAADWLAARASQRGAVLDAAGWTALYTGRTTYRWEVAPQALCDPTTTFIVVQQSDLEADTQRGKTARHVLNVGGEPVARFALPGDTGRHTVLIYRWSAHRFRLAGKSDSLKSG